MNNHAAIGVLLILTACHQADRSAASDQVFLTSNSLAGIHLCEPMGRVNALFPNAQDSLVVGEDGEAGWATKVVALGPAEHVWFERSWTDTVHVWRISTNSPRFRTGSGLHVGTLIADVIAAGDSMVFHYPEGILFITLVRDSVGFQVDDSSAAAFWRKFAYKGDPLAVLDRAARISSLSIGGDCRARKAAA